MIPHDSEKDQAVPALPRHGGLAQEDAYFFRISRDLIATERAALDEARLKTERAEQTKAHWMRCPKCGNALEEVAALGVKSEHCPSCDGVFFDRAELDHLLAAVRPHRFRDALSRLVRRAVTPGPTNWRHIPI